MLLPDAVSNPNHHRCSVLRKHQGQPSKIVANGPRNDGPFQEGRSCALGRRCTILSNRRPSSHEWIPTAHRSNQPVRSEVYCNLPAAAKQSVARRDMMLAQLQHFGDLHLIARNFAMCAYILEHHSIHLNPLQSIHCSEQPLHSPAAGLPRAALEPHFVRKLQNRNFTSIFFWHSNFIPRGSSKIAILLQFLRFKFHFVRKSCRQGSKIAILFQLLTLELHFVRKGCRRGSKIAILLQFLTLEPHFVRKGGHFVAPRRHCPRP